MSYAASTGHNCSGCSDLRPVLDDRIGMSSNRTLIASGGRHGGSRASSRVAEARADRQPDVQPRVMVLSPNRPDAGLTGIVMQGLSSWSLNL
ncbi:hypothetical protein R1flu_015994 [Riccia fluitans]|uniref:Uncharacterized protein n=1 Tax=Riccia fluitans TaxID=41844 RepID=A0ABD1YKJ4_9MARC